ncbi:MAG: Fe-S cluster assembly ATPase SufC [Firmicutes bacterium]|nr:Fe-S cluster assembly ATPase SufC [Bacillota bacterium]
MFKVNNLTAKIADKTVLENLNLQINDGEIHVIMGRNGIGKSTLCKIIMNDKDYSVIGGSIIYNNKNILDLETYEVAREKIMLISQHPISIEGITNAEVLRTALREVNNENINIFEFNKKMEDACRALELDPKFIHKEVNVGASGGERKKVELLHAAILEPKFLILDELDSGLDVDALKVVCNFINEYHQKTNCSILLITHHPNIVEYIKPNYVHILDNGQIIKTGDYHLAYEIENEGFGANIMVEDGQNE